MANSKVLEDGTVFLNKDRYYTFYIVSNQLNLTGKAEFYDEHDALIHTEELKRTASNKGVHTYAKTIKIDSKVENAVKVDFYVEDNEGFLSPAESKNLLVRNEAYILKAGTVFKTRYYHTTFIENDSQVQYTLTGIPNFIGGAKLTYDDLLGKERPSTITLTLMRIPIFIVIRRPCLLGQRKLSVWNTLLQTRKMGKTKLL